MDWLNDSKPTKWLIIYNTKGINARVGIGGKCQVIVDCDNPELKHTLEVFMEQFSDGVPIYKVKEEREGSYLSVQHYIDRIAQPTDPDFLEAVKRYGDTRSINQDLIDQGVLLFASRVVEE